MRTLTVFAATFLAVTSAAYSQPKKPSGYAQLGQIALLDGDFKTAISHLEKSLPADSNNAEVLVMLGYSYYHTAAYSKSINAFSRAISLKPEDQSMYYYRGKAKNILATQMNSTLPNAEKEKLLQAAIKDFTRGAELLAASKEKEKDKDINKFYQNRGLANRDLGILKSQKIPKFYDKAAAAAAYRAAMADFQKVLDYDATRSDILVEFKKSKVYLANLDN